MKRIVVIGGGFVGQLVQHAIPTARLLDARKIAPTDHLDTRVGPQYLWEPIPGCKSISFPVETTVDGLPPTPESILAYKQKIGKENDGGDWGLQFQHHTTGWRSFLPKPTVEYNAKLTMTDLVGKSLGYGDWQSVEFDILVNTIPLPQFLSTCILGPTYRDPFLWDPIYMVTTEQFTHTEEAMLLNYRSGIDDPWYRDTIDGTKLFRESLTQQPGTKAINPGKIHTNRDSESVLAQLSVYDCFCFGRFATWRPDELAHETWKHIVEWKEVQGL